VLSCGRACALSCGRACALSCGRACVLSCGRACALSCGCACELSGGRACVLSCGRACTHALSCGRACALSCGRACVHSCAPENHSREIARRTERACACGEGGRGGTGCRFTSNACRALSTGPRLQVDPRPGLPQHRRQGQYRQYRQRQDGQCEHCQRRRCHRADIARAERGDGVIGGTLPAFATKHSDLGRRSRRWAGPDGPHAETWRNLTLRPPAGRHTHPAEGQRKRRGRMRVEARDVGSRVESESASPSRRVRVGESESASPSPSAAQRSSTSPCSSRRMQAVCSAGPAHASHSQ
jgi:hypothetical protein